MYFILQNLMVQLQVQKEDMKSQIMNNYKLTAKKEHTRILQRRLTIEQRKEQLEHLNDQRVRIVIQCINCNCFLCLFLVKGPLRMTIKDKFFPKSPLKNITFEISFELPKPL